jgi:hypothetical protein
MKKEEKAMLKKQVLWNFIAIILIVLIVNLGVQLKPGNIHTTNSSVKLEWTGLASYALIDENSQFTSPLKVEKSDEIQLKPGTYYWCVPFLGKCLAKQQFAVDSTVIVTAGKFSGNEENTTYRIGNEGNAPIGLTIRKMLGKMITGFAIIDVGKSANVTINESSEFIAEQNG